MNSPPENIVPGAQTTNEDVPLIFRGSDHTISIHDADAGDALVGVKLTAQNGTLTLSRTTNLTLIDGTGTDDSYDLRRGTTADINSALKGLAFKPLPDYSGEAGLWVQTIDYGNQGTGGPYSDLDWIAVTVAPVNDAPVNHVPGFKLFLRTPP